MWTSSSPRPVTAVADPARDFAPICRDFGPAVFDLALDHYGHPFDRAARGAGGLLRPLQALEDIAYGVHTPGASRYAHAELIHLARTFA